MIDPDFLDELARFDASLDRRADDPQQGEQESQNLGEGLTFADYRRYSPGDDIRLVDWRLYARTEEYYIKQFEEERNLTVHVLIDASGSMGYGGPEDRAKFEFAAKLGLGFAYLTAEENNDVRISTFAGDHERLDTGRSNRGEILRSIDLLNETEPTGEAAFERALAGYESTIESRSLVVVASDFLADPDDVEAGLGALAENDLVCPQVLAPEERDPEAEGDTVFVEPETGAEVRTYFGGSLARTYRDRLEAHVETISSRCRRLGAGHSLVTTDDAFFDAFSQVWIG
ncbi:MAG: DUF58 domain-containing protein [Haloferacaceae archaeon]